MLDCVRLKIALEHAARRFELTHQESPSLSLVLSSFSTNDTANQIKNAAGLACKICVASTLKADQIGETYYVRIRNNKLYRTLPLINHFKLHSTQHTTETIDWRQNMIEAPEASLIGHLLRATGMDDNKLRLVAAIFPDAFPKKLPEIGYIREPVHKDTAARLLDRLDGKKKKKQGSKKRKSTGADQAQPSTARSRGKEYDPLRPQLEPEKSSDSDDDDDARFDTDVARKTGKPPGQAEPAAGPALSPEVLFALESLRRGTLDTGVSAMPAENRSPSGFSVGKVSAQAPNDLSGPVPDIGSLLASLAPRASFAGVPNDARRDVQHQFSPHKRMAESHPRADHHHRPSRTERDSSITLASDSHANPAYGKPTNGVGNELEGVLTRAALGYEQLHRSGPEPSGQQFRYADHQPPEHHYAPAAPYQYHDRERGPPPTEYRQVYYNEPRPQAHQPPPHYNDPPYGHPPQGQGEPVFVDQYGRRVEVIRVAEAPTHFSQASQQQRYKDYPAHAGSYAQPAPGPSGVARPAWYEHAPPRPTYVPGQEYQQHHHHQEPAYYQQAPPSHSTAPPYAERIVYVNEAGQVYNPNPSAGPSGSNANDGRTTRY